MWFWFAYIILPIVGGSLAAAGYITAKQPNAGRSIRKLAPYRGAIGVTMLIVGIFVLFDYMGSHWRGPAAVGALAVVFSLIVVGFLLGFGVIAGWLPGRSAAEERGVVWQKKLMTYTTPLGLVSIAGGVIMLLAWLF